MPVKPTSRHPAIAQPQRKDGSRRRPAVATRVKNTTAAVPRTHANESTRPTRKYLSPSMLAELIREAPISPAADRGPAKPPFEIQES